MEEGTSLQLSSDTHKGNGQIEMVGDLLRRLVTSKPIFWEVMLATSIVISLSIT